MKYLVRPIPFAAGNKIECVCTARNWARKKGNPPPSHSHPYPPKKINYVRLCLLACVCECVSEEKREWILVLYAWYLVTESIKDKKSSDHRHRSHSVTPPQSHSNTVTQSHSDIVTLWILRNGIKQADKVTRKGTKLGLVGGGFIRHVTIADCVVRVVGSWVIEDRLTRVFFCPRPINWSNCRLSTCILIKCALIKCILNSCKIHRTQWTKMDADEDSVGPEVVLLRLASLFHNPRLKIHCSDYAIIYDFTYLGLSCLYLPGTSNLDWPNQRSTTPVSPWPHSPFFTISCALEIFAGNSLSVSISTCPRWFYALAFLFVACSVCPLFPFIVLPIPDFL